MTVIGEPFEVTLTFCVDEPAPKGRLKVIGFGFATRPNVLPPPMVRVTVKLTFPDGVLTVTVPVSLPVNRADGFTCTSTTPKAPVTDGWSQPCPVFVLNEKILLTVVAEPLRVIVTFCDVVPDPAATLKVTGLGLAARPNPPPPVPTFRLTVKVVEPKL